MQLNNKTIAINVWFDGLFLLWFLPYLAGVLGEVNGDLLVLGVREPYCADNVGIPALTLLHLELTVLILILRTFTITTVKGVHESYQNARWFAGRVTKPKWTTIEWQIEWWHDWMERWNGTRIEWHDWYRFFLVLDVFIYVLPSSPTNKENNQ